MITWGCIIEDSCTCKDSFFNSVFYFTCYSIVRMGMDMDTGYGSGSVNEMWTSNLDTNVYIWVFLIDWDIDVLI